MTEQRKSDNALQLVGFTVGEERFAIDISDVHEINRFESINRIPDLPDHILGVVDLRGIVIPIINLGEKLGIERKNITKDTRIIIVGFNGEKIGILVDTVSEVLRIEESHLERPPSIIQDVNSEYIAGIIRNNNHLTVVLDLPRLFKDFDPALKKRILEGPEKESPISEKANHDDAMGKILEATKAMSEGDFHQEIDAELYGQIGEIARYINTTLKRLQSVEPNVSQVSDKIPAASMQLSEITKATEEATHGIMSQAEHVLDNQDLILHHLETLEKGGDVPKTVFGIREIVSEDKENLLNMITGLSFQDLTGQKIKTIVSLIEEVEKKILQLIVTFGLKSKDAIEGDNAFNGLSNNTEIKQELVDSILKEFGFE